MIVIETVKLLNLCVVVSLTMMRDGIIGVKAICYLLLCGAHQAHTKVSRRHRRLRLKRKLEDEEGLEEQFGLNDYVDDPKEPDL